MVAKVRPGKKKRGLIRRVFSFVILSVSVLIAAAFLTGHQSTLMSIIDFATNRGTAKIADEFFFDIGRGRVFAVLDKSIAGAGTLGIQVLNADGTETLRESFKMTTPAITAQNGRAVAYDIGGTSLRVFSGKEVITSLETGTEIISATLNKNAWMCLCAKGAGAIKSIVTVFDASGKPVYEVKLVSGYVLSAALSPDNKSLSILNFADSGSRITFYNLNNENVDRIFELPDEIILDMRFLSTNELLAISTDSLFLIDSKNAAVKLYAYPGQSLGGYQLDGDFFTLHVLDYGLGSSGKLITLDKKGRVLGLLETDMEIISLSSIDRYLAVLMNDEAVFYDKSLKRIPLSEGSELTAGATGILALRNGAALVTGSNTVITVRVDD